MKPFVAPFPFGDRQQTPPAGFCPGCGGEVYPGEPWDAAGLCPCCAARESTREENAMTLREMGGAYRDQAEILHRRIRELETARAQCGEREEKERLSGRIELLRVIWRETRDLAVLLERYYERGYRRNGRYTL